MVLWARAALILAILLFAPHLLESFEAPKAAALQVVGLGALGAAAAAWWRARGRSGSAGWRLLDLAVLLWLCVDVLATVASRAPRISFFGDSDQHEGLLTSLSLAGVYASARLGTRTPGDARHTLGWMVAASALSSTYALFQAAGLDRLPWQGLEVYAGGWFMRPFGTLDHPNVLGVMTGAGTAVATGMAVVGPRRRWWLVAGAMLGLTTALTLSRGAWLGGAVGSAVSLGLALRAGRKSRGRSRGVALALVATGLVLMTLFATIDVFRARVLQMLWPMTGSTVSRMEIWRIALAMWRAHPWTGAGLDLFGLLFQRYQTPEFWRL